MRPERSPQTHDNMARSMRAKQQPNTAQARLDALKAANERQLAEQRAAVDARQAEIMQRVGHITTAATAEEALYDVALHLLKQAQNEA